MKILQGDVWKRRGVSLLWGGESLSVLAQPQDVVSIRQFFALVGQWPDDLPCNNGNTLVVADWRVVSICWSRSRPRLG